MGEPGFRWGYTWQTALSFGAATLKGQIIIISWHLKQFQLFRFKFLFATYTPTTFQYVYSSFHFLE